MCNSFAVGTPQNEQEFREISTLFNAIKAQHCPTGRPRWIDDPTNAVLRVFPSRSAYTALGPSGAQAALAKQQLVIHKWSQERLNFDRDGLERAGDLNQMTSIQGECVARFMHMPITQRLQTFTYEYRVTVIAANAFVLALSMNSTPQASLHQACKRL